MTSARQSHCSDHEHDSAEYDGVWEPGESVRFGSLAEDGSENGTANQL